MAKLTAVTSGSLQPLLPHSSPLLTPYSAIAEMAGSAHEANFDSHSANNKLLSALIDDNNNHINADDNRNTSIASNLSATITTVGSNVTRVLYTYFQNITEPQGYAAAATTTTTTAAAASKSVSDSTTTARLHSLISNAAEPQIGSNDLPTTSQSVSATLLATAKTLLQAPLSASANATRAATVLANATASISASAATYATELLNSTLSRTLSTSGSGASAAPSSIVLTTSPNVTYLPHQVAIRSFEDCAALFANYTQPQNGK